MRKRSTPHILTRSPKKVLRWNFSFKKSSESKYKKAGEEDAMIGILIEGASLRPRKKNEMFIVIPKREKKKSAVQSFLEIVRFGSTNGNRRNEAPRNLIKANVNGGIFSSESLKIGEAIPQMIFALIRATMAFLCEVESMGQFL